MEGSRKQSGEEKSSQLIERQQRRTEQKRDGRTEGGWEEEKIREKIECTVREWEREESDGDIRERKQGMCVCVKGEEKENASRSIRDNHPPPAD